MNRCDYLMRIEFSQSQSRAAYFQNFAVSRELRVELRRYTLQVCMLYNANENFRLVLLLDHSFVLSPLNTAMFEADYFMRDLIRPLEILCDFCGHRTNVSWRLRQRCPEINLQAHLATESQSIRY